MSKASNTFESEILALIFQNASIPDIGDASGIQGSATAGSLYVRLCTNAVTADDATIGTEAAYTGYVAGGKAVARSAAAWTVSGGSATNANDIEFPACTGGSETISFVEIWRATTGTEIKRVAWCAVADQAIASGKTPRIVAGALTITMD